MTYAIIYIFWFLYYVYLTAYFYRMGHIYASQILEYQRMKMLKMKVISLTVSTIFVLGSVHFFLYNALTFILIAYKV